MKQLIVAVLLGPLLTVATVAQRDLEARPTASGGELIPEQASIDVLYYELRVRIDPGTRSISGSLGLTARVVQPTTWLVLDLDRPLSVTAVQLLEKGLEVARPFQRRAGRIWIPLGTTYQPGQELRAQLHYAGVPREAPRPPWVGGFVWSETKDGKPWIGVACQVDGADVWWPVKDHPSDEPDQMDIHITVPKGLTAVSNGVLQSVSEAADTENTFHWKIINPINVYNVTVNVAPYQLIESDFESLGRELVPLFIWYLPGFETEANWLLPQVKEHLAFHEELLGPYPFRNEKYGVVQTSYLGMEHQTAISYGSQFSNNEWGFDWLHFHELSHEWWGNLVSVRDWSQHWIHEGFASYMEALYVERLNGPEALSRYVKGLAARTRNRLAVAPRESQTSVEKYFSPPGYTRSDGDINTKGAVILHSLRFVLGEEVFFKVLRRFAYPTPEMERVTDGSQVRFAGTEDLLSLAESLSGRQLDWFFEVYLRQPQLPELLVETDPNAIRLKWKTPKELPFPMPVPVQVDGEVRRIEVTTRGWTRVESSTESGIIVDPRDWLLRSASPASR